MAKKTEAQTLYFNKETLEVTLEAPEDHRWKNTIESFIPSRAWGKGETGWIVFGEYGTYDSDGPGSDYIDVIDLYTDETFARTTIQKILEYKKTIDSIRFSLEKKNIKEIQANADAIKKDILNAQGKQVHGLSWLESWGYIPKNIQIQQVQIAFNEKPGNVYTF